MTIIYHPILNSIIQAYVYIFVYMSMHVCIYVLVRVYIVLGESERDVHAYVCKYTFTNTFIQAYEHVRLYL